MKFKRARFVVAATSFAFGGLGLVMSGTGLLGHAFANERIEIGGALSVKNQVNAHFEDATNSSRKLIKGDKVRTDEIVSTGPKGIGQFQFIDRTKLAIGPNSKLKLDKFVFNPNPKARKIVIKSLQGSLRFVSGISPSKSYTIQTPVSTIGIRGTMVDVHVDDHGNTTVALIKGRARVCSVRTRECRRMNRPGRFLRLAEDGIFTFSKTANVVFLKGVTVVTAFPFLASRKGLGKGFIAPTRATRQMLRGVKGISDPFTKGLFKPFKGKRRSKKKGLNLPKIKLPFQ